MDEKILQSKIRSKVLSQLAPLLKKYDTDSTELESMLKWKPLVLILGNYSSGKSTFINELVGKDIQRTGQAPTDDSFTIITSPEKGGIEGETPGSDIVNNQELPFVPFKAFGEQFISHLRLKKVDSPLFENLAIIDSPGMLDSVSEKDRGYDYTAAVKEFAKLADIIVLMFDPHKAGTIKETYNTIRNTLPEATGEDRVIFVMSRIDECDNKADLVRSYGTLCWNLSQMTGRKDIPRVYLTFSPDMANITAELEVWAAEREQLKRKVKEAPELRIGHILQNVDRKVQDLMMVAEAMRVFADGGKKMFSSAMRNGLLVGAFCFLFLDVVIREIWGVPEKTFLSTLTTGVFDLTQLVVPMAGLLVSMVVFGLFFFKFRMPRYFRQTKANIERLVMIDTVYRKNVWDRVRPKVEELLAKPRFGSLFVGHAGNIRKLERFSTKTLKKFYQNLS
nr:dynamin family protein [Desulfobulbaceae bacterium]